MDKPQNIMLRENPNTKDNYCMICLYEKNFNNTYWEYS